MKIRSMLLGAIALSSMMVAGGDELITQELTAEQQELKELKKFCKLLPLDIKKIIIKDVTDYVRKELFEDSDEWLDHRLRNLEMRKDGTTGTTYKLLRSDSTEISFDIENNKIIRSSNIPTLKKQKVEILDLGNESISMFTCSPDHSKILLKKTLAGIKIYHRDTQKILDVPFEFDNRDNIRSSIAVSNDGEKIAILEYEISFVDVVGAGRDYYVYIWDVVTHKVTKKQLYSLPLFAHNHRVKSFSFNHKGTKIGACFIYDVHLPNSTYENEQVVKLISLKEKQKTNSSTCSCLVQ